MYILQQQGRMQDIAKGDSFYNALKIFDNLAHFWVNHVPFWSLFTAGLVPTPSNRAAARKTAKETISFLIIALIK
jgi:hypothetical protein